MPRPSSDGSLSSSWCAPKLAGDGIAHAHGDRRRRRVALFDHVEVVIEGRLVHLGHRQLHLGGKSDQVRRRQTVIAVLDLVQVLDQQVAASGRVAKQRTNLLVGFRIDRPAFRRRADLAPLATSAGLAPFAGCWDVGLLIENYQYSLGFLQCYHVASG